MPEKRHRRGPGMNHSAGEIGDLSDPTEQRIDENGSKQPCRNRLRGSIEFRMISNLVIVMADAAVSPAEQRIEGCKHKCHSASEHQGMEHEFRQGNLSGCTAQTFVGLSRTGYCNVDSNRVGGRVACVYMVPGGGLEPPR